MVPLAERSFDDYLAEQKAGLHPAADSEEE